MTEIREQGTQPFGIQSLFPTCKTMESGAWSTKFSCTSQSGKRTRPVVAVYVPSMVFHWLQAAISGS